MLDFLASDRVYPPEVVVVMSTAFDQVCRSISHRLSNDADVRRRLASIILRHVDGGEHDPMRLAEVAFNELAGIGPDGTETDRDLRRGTHDGHD